MYILEPSVIIQVLFLADLALVRPSIEQGLRERLWTQEQIDQILHWLDKIAMESTYVRGIRSEHAFGLTFESAVRHPIRDPKPFKDIVPCGKRALPIGWAQRGFGVISLAYQKAIEQPNDQDPFGARTAKFNNIMHRLQGSPMTE